MKKVSFYLIFVLVSLLVGFIALKQCEHRWVPEGLKLAIYCGMASTLGGVLYCLRSVYLNYCVKNHWDKNWEVWYFIRPVTSAICGVVAYIFLKGGLVILDAEQVGESGNFGYLALAFLAGLNVDKFVEKVEDIGKSIFGIEKSRASKLNLDDNKEEKQ